MRYYHRDALGSTRALTTAGGAIAGTYDYDPYGRLLTGTTLTNPFLFAGQYTVPQESRTAEWAVPHMSAPVPARWRRGE